LLKRGIDKFAAVTVVEIKAERRDYLAGKYNVSVTADGADAAQADTVILAVKPQDLAAVMAGLKGKIKPDALVISIIAGARLETITSGLEHRQVVRVMPNTPARIAQGMSVWTATPEVSAEQRERAAAVMGAMGAEIYADDEKFIDMATAVSGSGPAYVFLFVEALAAAAREIGFKESEAGELAAQTLYGAALYLKETGISPEELRRMVTSPGGTTAAALAVLDEGDFRGLLSRAVKAAHRRAQELGG